MNLSSLGSNHQVSEFRRPAWMLEAVVESTTTGRYVQYTQRLIRVMLQSFIEVQSLDIPTVLHIRNRCEPGF